MVIDKSGPITNGHETVEVLLQVVKGTDYALTRLTVEGGGGGGGGGGRLDHNIRGGQGQV